MVMALSAICSTFAQESKSPQFMKYRNLGYSMSNLEIADQASLKSTHGGSFSVGRTYALNKKALCGLIYFGLDATWMDLNYTMYDIEYKGYSSSEYDLLHQGEYGMHFGPSITVAPAKNLYLQLYLRYAPTFTALYNNDTIYGAYTPYITSGVSLTYRSFGVGIEQRTGECTYSAMQSFGDSEESKLSLEGNAKLSGLKAYISFRF